MSFERFTDRARRVVVLAGQEAHALGADVIGTEHILLGLIREGGGVASLVLADLGISLGAVLLGIEEITPCGSPGMGPQVWTPREVWTPRAKKVFDLALREALQLGHNFIGTEHILLGLIREGEGVGAQVLVKMGADLSRVRQAVMAKLSGYAGGSVAAGECQPQAGVEFVPIAGSEYERALVAVLGVTARPAVRDAQRILSLLTALGWRPPAEDDAGDPDDRGAG